MKRMFFTLIAAASLLSYGVRAADEPKKPVAAIPAEAVKPAEAEKAAEATKPGPAPKIELDKTVYDFGSTSMVTQLAGKFIISNTGDGPLEKIKAQPSCGCTVSALKADHLAPGEKTELSFTLNVSQPRGHVEKHITVSSNDPKTPSVNLTLKADIVPTFDVTPANVSLGNIRQGLITNLTLQVKRLDGKPFGLTRAEAGQKFIRPKLTPVEGTNDSTELKIEIEAEGTPRNFNDNVRLYAGDAAQPAITVPVFGRIVGEITANPEAQFWGIADPENWPGGHPDQQVRKFQIMSNKPDAKLEITKATSSLEDVTVEVKPVVDGKSYEVTATLTKAPKQSETGKIKLETNNANQPTLELALTINVLKRN